MNKLWNFMDAKRVGSTEFISMKKFILCVSLFLLSMGGFAQEFEKPFKIIDQEIIDKYKSLYKGQETGDSYDPASGSVTFAVTDISIPGNSSLPVELSRWIPSDDLKTFSLGGGWYWDIPVIKANYMDVNPHISTGGMGTLMLSSDGWYGGKNCSQTFAQQVLVSNRESTHFVESWFYWDGKQLHIPGKTTEKFLEANETTPYVSNVQVTKSNYKVVECIALENNQEGFVVKGPDGTTYTFGKVKSYYTGAAPPTSYSPLTTFTKLIMVTQIKDRFGNTVNYEYNGPENSLSAIVGSDGRRIDITYKPYSFKGTLYYIPDFAEANEKRWTYEYSNYAPDLNFPTETRRILTKVTLPDNSYWSYSDNLGHSGFSPIKNYQVSNYRPDTGENVPGLCQPLDANTITSTVTSPEGLKTEYKFKLTYHGRSKVAPATQLHRYMVSAGDLQLAGASFSARNLNCSISYSLKEKNITGSGVTPQTWLYSYSENTGTYTVENPVWAGPGHGVIDIGDLNQFQTGSRAPTFLNGQPENVTDAEDYRTTTVTGPDSKTVYYIDRRFLSATEGSIVAEDSLNKTSNAILKRSETVNTKANFVGRHWFYSFSNDGPALNSINGNLIQYRVNKTQQKTRFYYSDGTDVFTTAYSDYDNLGFSGKLSESNNFSTNKRYTKSGVLHDETRWILGLPTTTQISADDTNYTTVNELVYHNAGNTGLYDGLYLPYEYKSYGTWVRRYPDFHPNGQVWRIIYNQPRLNANGSVSPNTYRFQYFNAYKRGKAQSISPPLRYSASGGMNFSRVINDDGLTTSITDLNGVTALYDYDLVGRLKNVDLPGDWLDTSIEWQEPVAGPIKRIGRSCTLNADKSGCEPGTITLESTSEYDALYRILKSGDSDVPNSTSRHQNVAYNSVHQPTFTSFKSESATEAQGTTNTYDNIGRLTSVTLSNGGTVTHDYLSGNKIKVTDAEGNATTTTYLAYGSQDYSQSLVINAPESITTTRAINIFGDLISTTQTGPGKNGSGTLSLTEYRAYDAMHYLCKVSRSDVGTTVFSNNLLGEVQWKAQGVGGGTVTDCDNDADANNKIHFTYDNIGDLWKVNYPDNDIVTAPDIIYTRDKNGNVTTIQVGNITQLYNYNELGLLEDEALQVDGKYFKLDYDYNAAGQLAHLTYPDGSKVSFSPNAFGESQSVIRDASNNPFTYANDILYYPNGAINSFNYGNGLTHKTTLNSRQLPASIKDSRSGFNALHYSYTYNNNASVTSLTDHIDTNYSISNFAYDGAGRLTATTGGTGIGSSTMRYDGLDNITYYKNKKHTLDYTYSAINRLQSVASSGVESKPYTLFTYDDRGNITHNSYHDFIYNRANQLVESGGNVYTYDAYNRRVVTKQGAKTTYSFYSQSGKLFYTETGGAGINYIYLGSRLIAKDGVIPENGNKQHYLPFGASIEGEINDVGYTGHKFDKDIGLSYMQARYYDPVIGRFMSPDPIGSADQFNVYSYVDNNPFNKVDPNGMTGRSIIKRPKEIGQDNAGAELIAGKLAKVLPEGKAKEYFKNTKKALKQQRKASEEKEDAEVAKDVKVSKSRYPESAQHIENAAAAGQPTTLTVDRANAATRRRESLRDTETKPGLDRDEFPPAMFQEGGKGASVKHINPSDNRGAGACIGAQCRDLPDGAKVRIEVVD